MFDMSSTGELPSLGVCYGPMLVTESRYSYTRTPTEVFSYSTVSSLCVQFSWTIH